MVLKRDVMVGSRWLGRSECRLDTSSKIDWCSLDFIVDRVFMKLFKTGNVKIVRECQAIFGFNVM